MAGYWTVSGSLGLLEIELHGAAPDAQALEASLRAWRVLLQDFAFGSREVRRVLLEVDARLTSLAGPHNGSLPFDADAGDPRSDSLARRLYGAARDGRLVARPRLTRKLVVSLDDVEPPSLGPAPGEEADVSFMIRFVDEIGQAIDGAKVRLSDGERRPDKNTDGSGTARIDDSPYGTATAKLCDPAGLRDILRPRWDTVRSGDVLDASSGFTICDLDDAGLSFDLEPNQLRTVSIQPRVVRARLIGPYFDTSKSFLLPTARSAIQAVVAMREDVDTKKMLIVGHTDTAGKNDYNDALSLERATSVKDFLLQNVEGWYAWYGQGKSAEKRWGAKEDLAMIGAMPDAGSMDASESPVRWYQRTRGLAVDGIAGTDTRHALIAEYMKLDDTMPPDSDITTHGCGEYFPQDPTPDGTPDAENRRVEILLLRPHPRRGAAARGGPLQRWFGRLPRMGQAVEAHRGLPERRALGARSHPRRPRPAARQRAVPARGRGHAARGHHRRPGPRSRRADPQGRPVRPTLGVSAAARRPATGGAEL